MLPNFPNDISRISNRRNDEWPNSRRYLNGTSVNSSRTNIDDYFNTTLPTNISSVSKRTNPISSNSNQSFSRQSINNSGVNTTDYINSRIVEPWENDINNSTYNSTWNDPVSENSRISNLNISRGSDEGMNDMFPMFRAYRDPERELNYFRSLRPENRIRYVNRLNAFRNAVTDRTSDSIYSPDETISTFASQSRIEDRPIRNLRNESYLVNESRNNYLDRQRNLNRERFSQEDQQMSSLYRPGPKPGSLYTPSRESRAMNPERRKLLAEVDELSKWGQDIKQPTRNRVYDDDDDDDGINWGTAPKKRIKSEIIPQFI